MSVVISIGQRVVTCYGVAGTVEAFIFFLGTVTYEVVTDDGCTMTLDEDQLEVEADSK